MTPPMEPDQAAPHLEDALRSAYAAQAASPTDELRQRVATVPGSVRPDRPAWRRPWFPVAAAAAAVVAVVFGQWLRLRSAASTTPGGVAVPPAYDPAHPSSGLVTPTGITFNAIGDDASRVATWISAIIVIALLLAVIRPLFRGRPESADDRGQKRPAGRRRVAVTLALMLLLAFVATAARNVAPVPLRPGSVSASGLGASEARSDGIDPNIVRTLSGNVDVGVSSCPSVRMFCGPRSVYAVAPGQPLTYVMSVRNSWPVGIRLLGRWRESTARTDATEPNGSTPTGLSLLRDPDYVDARPESTKPFFPVNLAPGEEVTLVVTEVARDCADPAKAVPARSDSGDFTIPTVQFVYEAFGIEGIATVSLSPEVTVPSNCP